MTVEKIRELLKVHIKAAEQSGKLSHALALTEILDVIDRESSEENHLHNDSELYKVVSIMNLGAVLMAWRLSERRSQRYVAGKIGISQVTLHRIEHGDTMDGRTLAKILCWLMEVKVAR